MPRGERITGFSGLVGQEGQNAIAHRAPASYYVYPSFYPSAGFSRPIRSGRYLGHERAAWVSFGLEESRRFFKKKLRAESFKDARHGEEFVASYFLIREGKMSA